MTSKTEQLVYAVLAVGVIALVVLPLIPPLPPPLGRTPCAPLPLAPDREVTGTLSPAGCRVRDLIPGTADDSFGEQYRLELAERSLVSIDLRSTEFDSHLTLLDAKRTQIDTNDDGGEGRNARLARPLEPGSYLLMAKALGGGRGRYTLRAGVRSANCPVQNLNLPATVSGRLAPGICPPVAVQGQNVQADQYRFTLTQRGVVLINLDSSDFDSMLRLVSSNYAPLAQDDDSGGGRNSRIIQELPPGTYLILAGPLNQAAGAYTLRVSFSPATTSTTPPGGSASRTCPLVDLALNRQVSGRLDGGDCRVRDLVPGQSDTAYAEQYRLNVPVRGALTIDMRSTELDSFLILLDSNRNQLARDDDGGEGSNSRISQSVGPGVYFVIANSYGGQNQGSYTLQASLAP